MTTAQQAIESLTYKIKSTGKSSTRLGNCEVCKGHCSEVFMQTERALKGDRHVANNLTHMLFGHDACLIQARGAA